VNNKNLTINFEFFIKKYKEKFKDQNIALAVSGGSDSLALAFLAKKFSKKYHYNVIAFTLDHQLRKESSEETELVKYIMKKQNIEHHSLLWSGKKPKTKIQETARIMRYNLFSDACIKHNCKYIFLGHHANDQVETFVIRLEAKSGLEGLACMREFSKILTESGSLELVRPKISYEKNTLKESCKRNK